MANKMNRYRDLAENLVRHDNALTIPKHVFVRADNADYLDVVKPNRTFYRKTIGSSATYLFFPVIRR